ncbi:hypothetical protein [Streptomyces demainii]|uniref:PE-PGRS family protein n=1 Tax=Streptomyces demainii TaxID=588122 RepID=A0ABT9KXC9_9ACTN|nr:hypothetical protein [Streptomyces demainii]MDP9613106.1 hypothetical protein [Streptomyces demainii]
MKPEDELLGAIEDRKIALRSHRAWQAAASRLYPLLQTVAEFRAGEIDAGIVSDVPWETLFDLVIRWHHEFPVGEGECDRETAFEVLTFALEFSRLEQLEYSVRVGAYAVRRRGNNFRVRHRWNAAREAADLYLEASARPKRILEITETEKRWANARPASSRRIPPVEVLKASADRAKNSIDAWREALPEGHLSDSFMLGDGLTLRDAKSLLAGIMGLASLCELAARSKSRLEPTLAHLGRQEMIDCLSGLCPDVSTEQIEDMLERLTYRPGRPARTSPLIEYDGKLVLCPPLITARAIDVIALRTAAHDASRFGRVGQNLRKRADAWATWLSNIPGVKVLERVKVRRIDGKPAGDLDVIAIDPTDGLGLCFEIKLPIDAVMRREVEKIEDWVKSAANQLDRIRAELASGGAVAKTPKEWPSLGDLDMAWGVGAPQQLSLTPVGVEDMFSVSLRYLLAAGEPTSLRSLVELLRCPDLPLRGLHFSEESLVYEVGRRKLLVDAVRLREFGWRPRFTQ